MFSHVRRLSLTRGHGSLGRGCLCLSGLTLAVLMWSGSAGAMCVAQHMQGEWVNADPQGVLRRIEMQFQCCDQIRCDPSCHPYCSPAENTVHVHGPCATGTCDWGTVVADYVFYDGASGYQVTRVDATFKAASETRRLVILPFGADSLLVHWSIDYPENSSQRDFSLIEYLRHRQCFTMPGGQKVCLELARIKMDPVEMLEKAMKEQTATTQSKSKPAGSAIGK